MDEKRWTVVSLRDVPSRSEELGAGWRSVRHHLGVASFGVNAVERNAGEELIELHDEVEEAQEELFLIIEGRASFTLDGDERELGPGDLLYAGPAVRRQATALASPTVCVMVGGRPGHPYETPDWDRD